ncbi:DinB family protein [Bacillus spongiae]|uniref:DinB family protein n=1 Tax=Bacillus spongiae TaxID=2683610 RepID=A0ABU8HFM5_9BACI
MFEYELMSIDMIRSKVLACIEDFSDEQINMRSADDKWSIAQLLRHLYDSEVGITHMVKAAIEKNERKPAKRKPLLMLLDRSIKAKVPKDRAPSTDFITKAQLISMLAESRANFLKLVNEISNQEGISEISISFPKFESLSIKQCVEFVGLHELRHFEQLNEIILDNFYVAVSK